jgi:hypothetical protein
MSAKQAGPDKKRSSTGQIIKTVLVLILLAAVLAFGYMQYQQFAGMTGAAAGPVGEAVATANSP